MVSNIENVFWKKKEFISFVSSILVLFIHSYFAPEVVNDSLISVINHKTSYFFSRSITQFAVPMFFMLSGISFFKGYDNKKYLTKIRSRVHTLIIPYLLWNTLWMLWEIATSYSTFPLTVTNILKGVLFYGCYQPFWFMFDIIVFSLAAPLLFLFIRNKYTGIATIVCLTAVSVYGIHLPESLFYYPMSIVFYMTGAVMGYHYFDIISKKSSKPLQIASLLFLTLYILAKNIVPREMHIDNYLMQTVVYTLAAFSLWNIVDIFIEKLKPRAIFRRSFAIYAMHLNIAIVILKILSFCLPRSEWMEIPKFVIMVVSTIAIINFVCAFLEKFLPKVYGLFMGNRAKSK